MQYNTLPRTSLKVSQLCLGTMMFGGQTSEEDSFRVMDAAHDLGVNFFDTANIYQNGETERIVGKWLKSRRNEVVLATKVRGRFGDGINDEGLSRDAILRAAEDSLRRLQTDHIDIYYLHMPDHDTALYETLQTMDSLVRAGKVRHVGVSNYAAWQVMEMLAICRECGFEAPIVTQNVWNLVTRGIEQELQGFLDAHPMGLCIYNPLAAGLLTGKYASGAMPSDTRFSQNPRYRARYYSNENLAAAARLSEIAQSHGTTLLRLSLRAALAQPHVTSVICGVSRPEQLIPDLAALEDPAPDAELCRELDDVWRSLPCDRFAYNR